MLSQNILGSLMRDPVKVSDSDIKIIAKLPNPPLVKLKNDDVFVRKCRLASDAIDSRFGRFRTSDMKLLLDLVQGAPVLIGHDKKSVGIARFFGGEVEKRGDVSWIIPRFYWPRAHSKANDLRVMIDSGVYSEASIAFIYEKPTCSICGQDLRSCSHWPGRQYGDQTCFFYYDNVQRVTEGSLVYRGAAPGTGFELDFSQKSKSDSSENSKSRQLKLKHNGKHFIATLQPVVIPDRKEINNE